MDYFRIIDGIIICAIGGLGSVFWYIVALKDREITEIKHDLNHIRENYVTKNDVSERFDRLENKIDKLFDRMYSDKKK